MTSMPHSAKPLLDAARDAVGRRTTWHDPTWSPFLELELPCGPASCDLRRGNISTFSERIGEKTFLKAPTELPHQQMKSDHISSIGYGVAVTSLTLTS